MADNSGVSKHAGAIVIDYVNHTNSTDTLDIAAFVERLEFSADIDIDCSVCEILIDDSIALESKRDFHPGDVISTSVTHDDKVSYERRYRVMRMEGYTVGERRNGYIIKCVSELFYKSLHTQIRRAYSGNVSEIARIVFDENTKENADIWEKSSNNISAVVPGWSPIQLLNWLAKKSSTSSGLSRMFFFQDTKQKYYFTSMQYLKSVNGAKPVKYSYMKDQSWKGGLPDKDSAMQAIQRLVKHNALDIKREISNGGIKNTFLDIDINTKSVNITANTYWDTYNSKNLNSYNAWKEDNYGDGNYVVNYMPSHVNIFPTRPKDQANETFTYGKAQQIEITVAGSPLVDVGSIVDIEIPQIKPHTEDNESTLDPLWSGLYVVVAKRDYIDHKGHAMTLRLAKDSIGDK